MRIGIVTLTDTDTALDLADALTQAGQSANLYLNQKSGILSIEEPCVYAKRLYDNGILSPSCAVKFYNFPRIRDPRSIQVVWKIRQDMLKDKIDVAHILAGPAEPWLAVLACVLKEKPIVSTIIVPRANVEDPLRYWVNPVNKLLIASSEIVIVNGQSLAASMQSQNKNRSDRIVHIPLGARTSAVKWSNKLPCEQTGTILFFGRSDRHKGLEILIRAQPIISRSIPRARILIVAHGEELKRCRSLIQDDKKFDIYDGIATGDFMAQSFARSSLVVLPYLSASTSGVLLTAYEFGKPVVATQVGCLPEYVIEGVTGLLVPPGQVEPFADAIIHLLQDDVRRHHMGENARRWAEEESLNITGQTINVYEKAISVHEGRKA